MDKEGMKVMYTIDQLRWGPYNVPLKSMTWTNGLFLVTFLANAPNQSFGVLESNKMLYIVWFSRKKIHKACYGTYL